MLRSLEISSQPILIHHSLSSARTISSGNIMLPFALAQDIECEENNPVYAYL